MTTKKGEVRSLVISALERGPGSIFTLAERSGLEVKRVAQNIADFRRACPGVVYIMRWERSKGKEYNWLAIYAVGELCSPEEAKARDAKRPEKATEKLVSYLQANPDSSIVQIAQAVGRHPSSVRCILTRMYLSEPRQAFVSSYDPDNRTTAVPRWSLGNSRNAPRPPYSAKERSARYHERNRAINQLRKAPDKAPANWITGLVGFA